MEINKTSEQKAYDLIKNGIINRKLAPGIQLIEATVAEKLDISRTPVRNALKKLSNEGLIKTIPNKGSFVIQPTIEEIEQAFEMRLELELMAIKTIIMNAMEDDITNLEVLVDREAYAIGNRDILEYVNINKEFHMLIAHVSRNKFLIQFTEKIIDIINIFVLLYDVFNEVRPEDIKSIDEHRQIINAIKTKNKEALETLIKNHLNSGFNIIRINKLGYKKLEDLF